MPKSVVLVVSPGRSGTQWLARVLNDHYGEKTVVDHEALRAEYCLTKFLRHPERYADAAEKAAIDAKFDAIAALENDLVYIETGWTAVGAIPLFIERFGAKVRVLQLTRHPVANAISSLTHGLYAPERSDTIAEWGQLTPANADVIQKDYNARWDSMSIYERCLFQWTEIHLYGEEIASELGSDRFLRVRSEDAFDIESGVLEQIIGFMGLEFDPSCADAASHAVDGFVRFTNQPFDWRQIHHHDRTIALAARCGYDLDAVDEAALDRRYRFSPANRLRRFRDKSAKQVRSLIQRLAP